MDWAMKYLPRVMSTAMAYYCWKCLPGKDRQTTNLVKPWGSASMFKWHYQTQ